MGELTGGIVLKVIGNILWFVFGGFVSGLGWWLSGLLWCITVIGIPWGRQCFKFASLSFRPFGREVVPGGGAPSLLANIVWLLVSGLWLAMINALIGLVWCITIVGYPFGKQFFKIANLALMPFGARVVKR